MAVPGVVKTNGLTVAVSVASAPNEPPPVTTAWFMTDAGAFVATLVFTAMAG